MIVFCSKTRSARKGKCQKSVKEVSTVVKSDEIACYLLNL